MSTGPVLRAGIVGAGWIGRRHAETIASRDDIEVGAVCDIDLQRAGAVQAGDPGLVLCPPADAARTLAVAVAAEQALATGRTVRVPA